MALQVCRIQILEDTYGVCLFDYCRRWFVDTTPQGAASVVQALLKFSQSLHSPGTPSRPTPAPTSLDTALSHRSSLGQLVHLSSACRLPVPL